MLGHSVGYHDRVHPYQVPGGVVGDHNSHHCSHDNLLEGHLNYRRKKLHRCVIVTCLFHMKVVLF